jgi:ribulose-5-phosphate 4-epimerase/fuculose-1-phosphate aldolase
MGAEKGAVIGVYVAAKMSEESRALGLALARAGVLGAAARLAQHWVSACGEALREGKSCAAALRMHYLLQAVNRHLPKVCARSVPPMLTAHAGRG